MGRLAGKTALITGGSSGIGLAAARLFRADSAYLLGEEIVVDGGMSLL